MSKVSDAERAFGSIFRSPEALEAIKASEEADKLVRRTNAAADARLKMRDDMSRAIEATNCMMVKVAGTAHFVRTNKIERDRTKTAEIIGGIRAVVGRWSWLGEGRGSYAWDDDRYQDEFRQMLDALKEATDPLRALAADWTDCPQDYQAARIDWKARAEAAETSLASARAEAVRVVKDRIDLWMNNQLIEMREGYDDSITGFNEAWDVVRSVFADLGGDDAKRG